MQNHLFFLYFFHPPASRGRCDARAQINSQFKRSLRIKAWNLSRSVFQKHDFDVRRRQDKPVALQSLSKALRGSFEMAQDCPKKAPGPSQAAFGPPSDRHQTPRTAPRTLPREAQTRLEMVSKAASALPEPLGTSRAASTRPKRSRNIASNGHQSQRCKPDIADQIGLGDGAKDQ